MIESLKDFASKRIELKRNEFIGQTEVVDNHIYFIESGTVKVCMFKEGEEQIIRFGYKNNYLVLLDSFLTNKTSQFRIQAIKKSSILRITKESFEEFLNQSRENAKLWQQILEDLVLQQIEREIDLLTENPSERYQRVFKRSPLLFQEIPNRHIANYLRMTPETLSRLKKLDFNQD